jgi:hypothetical protein
LWRRNTRRARAPLSESNKQSKDPSDKGEGKQNLFIVECICVAEWDTLIISSLHCFPKRVIAADTLSAFCTFARQELRNSLQACAV